MPSHSWDIGQIVFPSDSDVTKGLFYMFTAYLLLYGLLVDIVRVLRESHHISYFVIGKTIIEIY